MKVREIMKQPCISEKDLTLAQAAKIMSEHEIGSFLFVSKKRIKGIITDRDILKHFGKEIRISKIMSKRVISVGPDEDLEIAVRLMKKYNVKHLPVVENQELVGIMSVTDIAAHAEEIGGEFFFD